MLMPPGRPPKFNTPPRQRIRDAAIMAIKAEGMLVNVGSISRDAQCATQALYRIFPGRAALISDALVAEEEIALQLIDAALGDCLNCLQDGLVSLVQSVQSGMMNPTSPIGIAARLIATSPRNTPHEGAKEQLHRIGAALADKISIQQGWSFREESVAFWRAIVMTADLQLTRAMEAVFQVEIEALRQVAQPLFSMHQEERAQQFTQ